MKTSLTLLALIVLCLAAMSVELIRRGYWDGGACFGVPALLFAGLLWWGSLQRKRPRPARYPRLYGAMVAVLALAGWFIFTGCLVITPRWDQFDGEPAPESLAAWEQPRRIGELYRMLADRAFHSANGFTDSRGLFALSLLFPALLAQALWSLARPLPTPPPPALDDLS